MVRRGFFVASLVALALAMNFQAGGGWDFIPQTQAVAATRQFTSAWEIRDFINTIPGITHIPGPIPDNGSGAPRNDQVTANAICQFAGYQTAQITAASNYHSCGDNTIGYWNGSDFTIYGACNYNNFIHGLLCSNPFQCQDGADNDADGATDYPADFSCSSATDTDETNPKAQCQDGIDNDGDGLIDHPADGGCSSKQDNSEAGSGPVAPIAPICPLSANAFATSIQALSAVTANSPNNILGAPNITVADFDGTSASQAGFVTVNFAQPITNVVGDDFAVYVVDFYTGEAIELFEVLVQNGNGTPVSLGVRSPTQTSPSQPQRFTFDIASTGLPQVTRVTVRNITLGVGPHLGPDIDAFENTSVCGTPIVQSQCQNGTDDDGDGQTDFPADLGCISATDTDEANPTVDLKINGQNGTIAVTAGQVVTLSWTSTDAQRCDTGISNMPGWTPYTTLPTSGSQQVTVTQTGTYGIQCAETTTSNMVAQDSVAASTVCTTGANLAQNGTFETPTIVNAFTNNLWAVYGGASAPGSYPPQASISGWLPRTYQVELQKTGLYGNAFQGSQYAEIDDPSGRLEQDIATIPGTSYTISFAYALRPDAGAQQMGVYWGNSQVATLGGTPSGSGIQWQLQTYTVTATSSTTRLGFGKIGGIGGAGNFIDQVTVTANCPTATQCSDNIDNDNDGATDYPADFSCSSTTDNDETNPRAQCQDGTDNDGDGQIDFPNDLGCSSRQDNDESNGSGIACSATDSRVQALTQIFGTTPRFSPSGRGGTLVYWDVNLPNKQTIFQQISLQGLTPLRPDNYTDAAIENLIQSFTNDYRFVAIEGACNQQQLLSYHNNGHRLSKDRDCNAPVGIELQHKVNYFVIASNAGAVLTDVAFGGTVTLGPAGERIDGPGDGGDNGYVAAICNPPVQQPQCNDGVDNDGDGATDFPADFSCNGATDNDETNPRAQCQDGSDNDGDGLVDFPNDLGCSNRQDNDESGGSGGNSCQNASLLLNSIYAVTNGGTDFSTLDQAKTSAYCTANDYLLSGAGTGPSCDNASTLACGRLMNYEFDGYTANGAQQGWTSFFSTQDNAFYDTTRQQVLCAPSASANPFFTTYVRTTGAITDYYSLNQNNSIAYCDPGDTAIAGAGTNVYCDTTGNGGCGTQMLEFNGRIISGNREGWAANYSMIGDAFYDTIQTTVVCLKKTAAFDQNLRVYHVVNQANPVDYYSLSQSKTDALCDAGDIAIGGGGNPAFCDNSSNPACGKTQYLEFNGAVTVNGRKGWRTNYDLGGDTIYDTQRVAVTCLGLANSCNGGGAQCSDGIDNDNDGATDYPADFSCNSTTDTDETNPRAQCQDGTDNDGDGAVDYPADFSCASQQDNDETFPRTECQDGFDNDGDGLTDFPNDPGCSSRQDNSEAGGGSGGAQCSDSQDNDGDNLIDSNDPGCHTDFNRFNTASYNPQGTSEASNAVKGTCADGIDNNGNGTIDAQDAICHTDGNPNNTASFDPNRNETGSTGTFQCNDNTDNDGDQLIDSSDPGCHTDFNRFNTASYNPNGTSEASNSGKGTCADGIDNNANALIDAQDAACHTDGNPNNTASFDPNRNETGGTTGGNADLSVALTGPATVTKGGTVVYSATVTNNGPSIATNITVTDPPAGFTFIPAQSSAGCTSNGTVVNCTLASLGVGSSQTFTIAFTTSSSACNITVTDIATVTSANPDPNSANNQSQAVATIVSCQGTGAQCTDGQDNDGDGLVDNADPDCHSDGNAQNPSSFDGTRNESTNNSGQQCRNGRDDDNDGRIDASDPDCHSDGNPSNNGSYDGTRNESTSGTGDGCISIDIEDDRDPAEPGDEVEYEITLENDCSTSRTFTLTALLDDEMEFEDASGNGDDVDDDEVRWENITIGANDERDFTLTVTLDDDLEDGDDVELEVQASGEEETENTEIEEFGGGSSTGGGIGEAFSVSTSADRSEAQPNDTVSYTITVRNSGSRALENVSLENTFTSGQLSVLDPAGATVDGTTMRWNLDRLDPNTSRQLRFTTRMGSAMRNGDVVANTARLTANGRTTSASGIVRIVTRLPQTGIGNGRLGSDTANLRLTASSDASSAGSTAAGILGMVMTVASGLGAGALAGRKLFF